MKNNGKVILCNTLSLLDSECGAADKYLFPVVYRLLLISYEASALSLKLFVKFIRVIFGRFICYTCS